jgi:hypothetical protein
LPVIQTCLHGEALETAASIVIQANGEPFQPIGARGSELAIVETGSGYECRTRDGDASAQAKMSEHATGNAVDIMALGLTDKRQIAISVVAFTTVLAPMPLLTYMARAETTAFASRLLLWSDIAIQ